jgi:transmembrane sensor
MVREALTLERLGAMEPDEAAALLVVRRAEGLTVSETQLLDDWLAVDPSHPHALASVERTWATFDDVEEDEILGAMRAHALAPRRRDWGNWPRLALVAAAMLLVVATSLLLFRSPAPVPNPGAGDGVGWTQYASVRGRGRTITLSDGSVVGLDADSVAAVRMLPGERAIRLVRGRALFEVSPNPARPFVVTAADKRVVALGTRFVVDLGGQALKVRLLKGRVAVGGLQAGAQTVELRPGQEFIQRGGSASVRRFDAEGEAQPGWRNGLLELDDVPMGEAIAEVNRYSRDQIVIRDPAIAAMRVSGQFRAGNAERFARTVAEMKPVRVVRRDGEIEMKQIR